MCLSEREPLCTHQVTLSFLYSECAEQELLKFLQLLLMLDGEPGAGGGMICQPLRRLQAGKAAGQVESRSAALPVLSSTWLPASIPRFWGVWCRLRHTCTLREYYGTVVLAQLLCLGFCWHYVKAVLQGTGYLLSAADGLWFFFFFFWQQNKSSVLCERSYSISQALEQTVSRTGMLSVFQVQGWASAAEPSCPVLP